MWDRDWVGFSRINEHTQHAISELKEQEDYFADSEGYYLDTSYCSIQDDRDTYDSLGSGEELSKDIDNILHTCKSNIYRNRPPTPYTLTPIQGTYKLSYNNGFTGRY